MGRTTKVFVNGANGLIGRSAFAAFMHHPVEGVEIVGLNSLRGAKAVNAETFVLLQKRNSIPQHALAEIEIGEKITIGDQPAQMLLVKGKKIPYFQLPTAKIPHDALGTDVVLEITPEEGQAKRVEVQLAKGVKKAILSSPAEKADFEGVYIYRDQVKPEYKSIDTQTCTTNALIPPVHAIDQAFGTTEVYALTVHAVTPSQNLFDGPSGRSRYPIDVLRGLACMERIEPASTGAAKRLPKNIPHLKGRCASDALRVPVLDGSIVYPIVCITKQPATADKVNEVLREFARSKQSDGTVAYNEEKYPLTSSEVLGRPEASIIDPHLTRVIGTNMVIIGAWYDNMYGAPYTMFKWACYVHQEL